MADTTNPRPKRPNRSGSLHQFRHTVGGREYLRWRATGYFTPPEGKPKRLVGTGTTAAAAQEKLHQRILEERVTYGLIGRDALDLPERSKKRLLSDVADEWLRDREVDPKLRRNSFKGYEAKVRNYVLPHLGSTPVRMIDHDQIRSFVWDTLPNITTAEGTPVLGQTAHRGVFGVLQLILAFAVKRQYIDYSPIAAVRAPQKAKRTKEDIRILRDLADTVPAQVVHAVGEDPPAELRWLLAFHGLRQAEVLGLTDDCIHWYGTMPTKITIQQQLDRITVQHGCGDYDAASRRWSCGKQADRCPKRNGGGHQFIRYEAKSESGDRELPLTNDLRDAVLRHYDWLRKVRAGDGFSPLSGDKMDSLVFVKSNGHPIRPQDDRAAWARVLKKTGVSHPLRVHDARHLAATIAVNEGVSPDKIARIFGWSVRHAHEMIRLYAHPTAAILQDGMDSIGARLQDRRRVTEQEMSRISDLLQAGMDADLVSFTLTDKRMRAIPDAVRADPDKRTRALKDAQVTEALVNAIITSTPGFDVI
ncbi:site-specific integrase [Curtobacterium sp. TC1]|uniref:tyrosine-type recombinase/integrase n=1 Tax=Curtobacterium sp. TC1 TaxID=2862880 RepID=UPI001C9A927D|nr:tyrosine-type recombinase/integrase [Curtobacterium sp. TC1]QZQ54437.1 site-specific integrase [Curtobacterium sp. TC1]